MSDIDEYIFNCPEDRHYWVVRASGGSFVRHFKQGEVVAIGHIDGIELSKPEPKDIDYSKLKAQLGTGEKGASRSAASITSHINQVKKFINEIQIDDFIITLDSNEVLIGRVTSDAFVEKEPIFYGHLLNQTKMPYNLRRSIDWGPILKRSEIPSNMDASLHAHQTVFNIDSYWAAVHHLMFPFFRRGNKFYFTINIRQKEDISNYSLGQLIVLLSDFEVIAKKAKSADVAGNFNDVFNKFRNEEKLTLSTKAEFMSPGEIWAAIDLSTLEQMGTYAIAYIMLFGGEIPHVFKSDGLIDTELRHKIVDAVTKRLNTRDARSFKEDLKLAAPKKDTEALRRLGKKDKKKLSQD